MLFKYFFTLRIFSRFTVFIGCAIFSIILCPGHALTQTIEQKSTFNIYESSGFALRGQDNDLKLAPLLASKVDYEIDGILARASVTQQFVNNQSSWQEGIYVFPLPETAAVDTLSMQINDRIIKGIVSTKDEAKKNYKVASESGKSASLIESERPNIFTASVANIAPGATITIEFEYQHRIDIWEHNYNLRLPLVVAPRYNPGSEELNTEPSFTSFNKTTEGHYEKNVVPPIRYLADLELNPVQLTINLTPGFPLKTIESTTHDINVDIVDKNSYKITLQQNVVPADKDFELVWSPAPQHKPGFSLFKETIGNSTYVLGFVRPPTAHNQKHISSIPREIIFVIDTSGSMATTSMEQAKNALRFALKRLRPNDSFNIIQFDDSSSSIFPSPMVASHNNILKALNYTAGLEGEGGTNILPALQAALRSRPNRGFTKQIVFITDGSVSNESEILREVASNIKLSRIFAVGIGSAPNSFFIRKLSKLGRGSYIMIDSIYEVENQISNLLEDLEGTISTDLNVRFPNTTQAEIYPNPLPDLYKSGPLFFSAKLDGSFLNIAEVSGISNKKVWTEVLPISDAKNAKGVAKLWARDSIDQIEESTFEGVELSTIEKAVTELALNFGLLTKYTSLIAIDAEAVRSKKDGMISRRIPSNLPAGWDYKSVFGGQKQPFEKEPVSQIVTVSLDIPQGSTNSRILIMTGSVILIFAAIILFRKRLTSKCT